MAGFAASGIVPAGTWTIITPIEIQIPPTIPFLELERKLAVQGCTVFHKRQEFVLTDVNYQVYILACISVLHWLKENLGCSLPRPGSIAV